MNRSVLLIYSPSCPLISPTVISIPILMVPVISFSSHIVLPDLSEYLMFYEEQNQCLGMTVPSFDRPSLEFTPSREEFLFVPPQIASKSFLYSRIEKPVLDQSLRKYHLSWQKTLEKEDYSEVGLKNSHHS